jgi:hypothetical protein
MQTEFDFTLPRGYVDEQGKVHRHGRIRLATAHDEIEAVQHPQVQIHAAYLPLVLLGRVILHLGTLENITPQLIERLFAADISYLQDLYLRLNSTNSVLVGATCPHCTQKFQLQVAPLL